MIQLDTKQKKQPLPETANSEFSLEGLRQAHKNYFKSQHHDNVELSYHTALQDYLAYHGFRYTPLPFAYPKNFFCYYNGSVHFVFNKAFPFENNTQKVFTELLLLPCSSSLDPQVENNLLHALKNLLRLNKSLPKADVLLYEFEERNRYPFPLYNFFILDGMLCTWYTVSNSLICFALLYDSVPNWNAKNISLLKALKNSPYLLSFSYSKAANPYYVNYRISDQFTSLKYDPEKRGFQTEKPSFASLADLYNTCLQLNIPALYEKNINHLFHYIYLNPHTDLKPTDKLTHFLYELTNGNFQNLVNLAILCANIATPEILTPKLFLVSYSNKEIDFPVPEYFSQLLDLIFNLEGNDHFSKKHPTIGKLVQKQIVPDMANNIFEGTKLLYVKKSSASLSDTQLKKLKQYLKGSKVTGTDKKFGSVSFRNTSPIICFSNNQKEITYLEQNLPCVRINLDFINDILSLKTPDPYQDINDYEWLRTCLPLYGVYLLAEKKFHHQPLPKNKKLKSVVSADNGTGDFLNTCCVLSANDFVYTDELYSAYCFYYQTVHKTEPLKRTQFVKSLKQISGLTYKRPHTSRNEPNKYAFAGIALCPDWEEKVLSSVNSLSLEENAFKAKLEELTEMLSAITK